MQQIYFGITELYEDIFLCVSLDDTSIDIDFNREQILKLEELDKYEIYESLDGTYQVPPGEYSYYEIIETLEEIGLKHSIQLDNLLLED